MTNQPKGPPQEEWVRTPPYPVWLIERQHYPGNGMQPHAVWLKSLIGKPEWTDQAHEAVWLETEVEAHREIMRLYGSPYHVSPILRPTDHVFYSRPPGWTDDPPAVVPSTGQPELLPADTCYIEGTWPRRCEQRAFVAGAKWWEFEKTGATMWASDRDKAAAEAVRRYGEPPAVDDGPTPEMMIESLRVAGERAQQALGISGASPSPAQPELSAEDRALIDAAILRDAKPTGMKRDAAPSPGQEELAYKPQGPTTGMNAVFGKLAGTTTDAEVLAATTEAAAGASQPGEGTMPDQWIGSSLTDDGNDMESLRQSIDSESAAGASRERESAAEPPKFARLTGPKNIYEDAWQKAEQEVGELRATVRRLEAENAELRSLATVLAEVQVIRAETAEIAKHFGIDLSAALPVPENSDGQ